MNNPCQNSASDAPATITLHPDRDGTGLYVSIRDTVKDCPAVGLTLTPDQAERLKSALEWALVTAHARRVANEAKAREVLP